MVLLTIAGNLVALRKNASETLSDYWDEIEAQAAESRTDSDTRLAPCDQTNPTPSGRGRVRGRGRGRGRATGRGRGRGLRPVSKKLKK